MIGVLGREVQSVDPDGGIINASVLTFRANTRLIIASDKGNGPRPEHEEIPSDELLGELEAEFRCTYLVQGIKGNELDQDGLKEFAQTNVAYHFWPYWRELIQSMTARVKLPIPTLPSYTVRKNLNETLKATVAQ
ncbi:hypothetical protein PAMC26577_31015 [Caballeronia sordidicola]|uniref:Uncharacterized protein n=1 Tax=Caballeronia sordidicola TaxID=196367 RepID=A0A242MDV2_CABSO|nr:hypothetical protein PAMC26577_31015 [Caballeronia sordidicola]